jgi:hypothetical protein
MGEIDILGEKRKKENETERCEKHRDIERHRLGMEKELKRTR